VTLSFGEGDMVTEDGWGCGVEVAWKGAFVIELSLRLWSPGAGRARRTSQVPQGSLTLCDVCLLSHGLPALTLL
jgi:hypothetical protein